MTSYTTPAEWLRYPTGLTIADLVEGGTAADQQAALTRLIAEASSAIDRYCYQPLYAHQQTEVVSVRPDPYGNLQVRLRHWPARQLVSAQWLLDPRTGWQAIDLTLTVLEGDEGSGHRYTAYDSSYALYSGWGLPPLRVQTTYVAGYPNAQLTANVAAGATSLPVDTTVGMLAADVYTLFDGPDSETVTVASASGTTLTLAAPTQYAHNAGVRCSAVPEAVSLACILYTALLIKGRRGGATLMMAGKVEIPQFGRSAEWEQCRELLQPFRRVI
jgi:hypothetical protein